MSLAVAFVGIIFLFFLGFCMYFAWSGFFSSNHQTINKSTETLENSPEWRAFLHRRHEIEADPTLDESSKKVLIDNWLSMASESKPHMATGSDTSISRGSWAKPVALPWLILLSLGLATLIAYSTGAMNPGALKWPSLNPASNQLSTDMDQASGATAGHPGDSTSLEDRLAGLKARLSEDPNDLRGWVLLARTYASMSNYIDSASALKKALELSPGHPDILADLADMTAMAQGRQLKGEPETYIAAALQSDPRHEKALALAASAAEQVGDQDKAQVYWQLLSQVQQASLTNPAPAPEPADVLTTVKVNIPDAALKGIGERSALFVYLKAQAGPGMPLAVVRVPASQLGAGLLAVRIGAGDFIQETGAAQLPETLYVQARLSVQGTAQTTAGDIDSAWASVDRNQLEAGIDLTLPNNPASP